LFPTLLTLFVSPEWKRLGFERYFEMQAGNFVASAGYWMFICGNICFWRALTPPCNWARRPIGTKVASVF
jgi:hypothetical protein